VALSGFRTLASGSRDPGARAAAVRIAVLEVSLFASNSELPNQKKYFSASCSCRMLVEVPEMTPKPWCAVVPA
jgi:hypothetical protein